MSHKKMTKNYYVYILASRKKGTLYIGITNDLIKRIWQHRNKVVDGFTKKYGVDKLVYFKIFEDVKEAIIFEKQIKKWNREWKIRIIEEGNKNWEDLYNDLIK